MIDDDFDWYLDNIAEPGGVLRRTHDALWRAAAARAASTDNEHIRAAVRLARTQGLVLTLAQTRAAGLTNADARRLIRRGTWTAPRRNVLCVISREANDDEPHGLRPEVAATAAALVRPGSAISHQSAATIYGLPLLAAPVRPILTGPGAGEGRHDILVHAAAVAAGDVATWFGARVMTPERTVVDIARNSGPRAGLVVADAALRADLTTRAKLRFAVGQAARWPGVRTARRIVELADGLAESVLESMTRLLIDDAGLPLPELQVVVATRHKSYRVDGLWRDRRVILEVDGLLKYKSEEDHRNEKRRHEALERAGYRIVRVMWDDVVKYPAETIWRIREALRLGGRTLGVG